MPETFAALTAETITIDGFTYTIARDTDLTKYVVSEYLIAGNPAHKHCGGTPVLRSFTMFADGSGCGGVVEVFGRVVRVQYACGNIQAEDLPPTRRRDTTPRWKIEGAVKLAREAFSERFNAVVPEGWREKHEVLYA